MVGNVGTAEEAVQIASIRRPTVVIVDADLAGAEDLVARLRSTLPYRVEVIATTGFSGVDRINRMVLSGATAFVIKNKHADLVAAVRAVVSGSGLLSAEASRPVLDEVRRLYDRERSRNEQLEEAVSRLRMLSVTDPLTGLKNHGFFFDRLSQELDRARRYGRPLAVIIVDIDDFKVVNDAFGHSVGDRVLRSVGEVFRASVREVDVACRIGGEEFGFVLPETDEEGARKAAERIRSAVAALGVAEVGQVTVSAGVAVYPVHAEARDELIEAADMALYQAKHEGKNCVRVAGRGMLTTEITRAHPVAAPVVDALLGAFRLRLPGLYERSYRVADVAVKIGRELDMSVARQGRLHLAALVHDIGMIAVPDSIMFRDGPLEPPEWERVRSHPRHAVELLARAVHPEVVQAVLMHHERIDGTGYPNGVAGESIPQLARVLHVADAFVAMTSMRPYGATKTPAEALTEMQTEVGADFDADVVAALGRVYGNEGDHLRLVAG